jgi:hypothetical protein
VAVSELGRSAKIIKMNSLSIPPAAEEDPNSIEIARIWAAGGKQHVTMQTGLWKDPGAWGLMLVDLARHAANAYYQTEGRDRDEVLRRIKAGFDAEWEFATSDAKGSIQ